MKVKIGDRVLLYDPFYIESEEITGEMLKELGKYSTQEVEEIDKEGYLTFADIPYKWPQEVIIEVLLKENMIDELVRTRYDSMSEQDLKQMFYEKEEQEIGSWDIMDIENAYLE